MGCHQLSRLEISPYQEGLLVRGVCCWHQGQVPNRWMEQAMGYAGAVGMMLMDKVAGVCEQAEGHFTGIWTDIGKVETELEKAREWSARVQDEIDGLEVLVWCLEGSRQMMRLEMDEMIGNMNSLLELNQQMIQSIHQLRTSQVHGWDNLIVINDKPPVVDTAPILVPGPVIHVTTWSPFRSKFSKLLTNSMT